MELALLGLHEQRGLQQALEYSLDIMNMFILGPGEDQDVVQVDKHVLVQQFPFDKVYLNPLFGYFDSTRPKTTQPQTCAFDPKRETGLAASSAF